GVLGSPTVTLSWGGCGGPSIVGHISSPDQIPEVGEVTRQRQRSPPILEDEELQATKKDSAELEDDTREVFHESPPVDQTRSSSLRPQAAHAVFTTPASASVKSSPSSRVQNAGTKVSGTATGEFEASSQRPQRLSNIVPVGHHIPVKNAPRSSHERYHFWKYKWREAAQSSSDSLLAETEIERMRLFEASEQDMIVTEEDQHPASGLLSTFSRSKDPEGEENEQSNYAPMLFSGDYADLGASSSSNEEPSRMVGPGFSFTDQFMRRANGRRPLRLSEVASESPLVQSVLKSTSSATHWQTRGDHEAMQGGLGGQQQMSGAGQLQGGQPRSAQVNRTSFEQVGPGTRNVGVVESKNPVD
ncbi:unnamed protein product, partial [Amoebophrya sp. A25]